MQMGYLGFNLGVPLNHWALWVEFTYQAVFGYEIPVIVQPPTWHLKLQDPWIVCHYNEVYANFLQADGLAEWVFALEQLAAFPTWLGLVAAYNELDKL